MVQSSVLGFPRIGGQRELKKITESYWNGKVTVDALLAKGKELRKHNWELQQKLVLKSLLLTISLTMTKF